MIAHWRIPSFLRLCDIVCCLERGFPISFHTSAVPREVLASGSCLFCSKEMAEKQVVANSYVDGKNIVIIQDPRDTDELSSKLRYYLGQSTETRVIGKHGQYLSNAWEEDLQAIDGFAEAIETVINGRLATPSATTAPGGGL